MPPPLIIRKAPWQFLLVFFILVISISSVGFFYYESQKKQIKEEKQNELLAIADLKVSQIVNWRKERLADAATIRANFLLAPRLQRSLQNSTQAKGKKEIRTWLQSFKEAYQYDDVLLLDKKGNVLLSVAQKSEVIGPETKKLASQSMKTRETTFSDLYRNGVSGRIQLNIVAPILAAEGTDAFGVFLLRIDPYVFLYPLIERWPTPSPTAETMLIRREGNEVLYLNDVRHRKGTALTLRLPSSDKHLPAAMAAQGKEGILEGIDYRGTQVLAAVRTIPDSPWSVVSKVDKEEVYAPIRGRLWNVMIVIGLCILSAGAGGVLIWRRWEEEEQRSYRTQLEETVRERTAELENVNRRLEASYKDMESFSYSASHDLRTPLIAIHGFARRLLKDHAGGLDPNAVELLNIVKENARRMEQLLNDLLVFSRASTKEIQVVEIDMGALVARVFDELRPTMEGRDVRLVMKALPVGHGDASLIRQVLINLLSNAIKFTKSREVGIIEVDGTEEGTESAYSVKDNGIGFDMQVADKLFGLFQRLNNAQAFEGTGIGLVITKRIIEKHNGRIRAEGRLNEGATFYFTLPRQA
ncbi:MAG: ATP-binding protein [Thermodesulfovibrionales bacterium]|jgi:signal transduction histidine kinase